MIYDLDSDNNDSDTIMSIFKQNLEGQELTIDNFLQEFKCVHKFEN